MNLGFLDINAFCKFAIQIKTYDANITEPPLNEMEMAICEYIQANVKFPIFKNYSPNEETSDGCWISIFIASDFDEISEFFKENRKRLQSYRIIHSRMPCRKDDFQLVG